MLVCCSNVGVLFPHRMSVCYFNVSLLHVNVGICVFFISVLIVSADCYRSLHVFMCNFDVVLTLISCLSSIFHMCF